MNTASEGKTAAIIGYLTIIGTVIALVMNNEKKNTFAAFHIRQALGLFLTQFMLGYLVGAADSWTVSYVFWGVIFALWLIGFSGAAQGVERHIPLLGPLYQKLFKSIP